MGLSASRGLRLVVASRVEWGRALEVDEERFERERAEERYAGSGAMFERCRSRFVS